MVFVFCNFCFYFILVKANVFFFLSKTEAKKKNYNSIELLSCVKEMMVEVQRKTWEEVRKV